MLPLLGPARELCGRVLGLCALYALLRFLLIGYTASVPTREGFVDAAAAAFRLIEHSRFDHNAAVLLRRQGTADDASLGNLLAL